MEGRCSDVLRLGVMVNYIRSDESLQVLIFVVLPLVLLLVTGIFTPNPIHAAFNCEIF